MEEKTIIKSVFLFKQKSKFCFFKKYMCVLFPDKIVLHKIKKNSKQKEIPITGETEIRLLDSSKKEFSILQKNRIYNFISNSAKVFENWISQIKKQILYSKDININCFDIISFLGNGYYGDTYLFMRKHFQNKYAVKVVSKEKSVANNINIVLTEKNILKNLNYPFIVKFKFSFQSENMYYLGLEYLSCGNLKTCINSLENGLSMYDIKLIIAEVALALNYLHQNNIVYRDLKQENIMIDKNGYIKLIDFGLSISIKDKQLLTDFCGTPEYIAPEIINRMPYDYSIDLWQLGILTYTLIFGREPFQHTNLNRLYQIICNNDIHFPPNTNSKTISFISGLLEKNPQKRFKISDVMNHTFFDEFDFLKIEKKEVKLSFIPKEIGLNLKKGFTI